MKISKYILLLFSMLIFTVSCNDFLDVNTDPTKVSDENINVTVLLPTILYNTSNTHYSQGNFSSQVTHHLDVIASAGGYYEEFTMEGAWSTIYLSNLSNINIMIEKAQEEGSSHYVGIGKVLKALNLGLLTDAWENIPYSEALQGANNVSPKYDTQESIYTEIQKLLDEGLVDLASTTNYRVVGKDDFIYGGKIASWIKLAHTLKARYLLHLANKTTVNWNTILDEVKKGISANTEDFDLKYNINNPNPWFTSISSRIPQVIYTLSFGRDFMNVLNGEIYTVVDPRISKIAAKVIAADPWTGAASWESPVVYNILPRDTVAYFGSESALSMVSFAEAKFIEAEANLKLGKNPESTVAYKDGIKANMTKLKVPTADMNSYLNDVAVVPANTDLEHIMKEKYIALELNPEIWNDMRRYNFDNKVFKFFVEPDYKGRNIPAQRAVYPTSESSRNATNYTENYKAFTVKMWKD
jgi:hypothetical protein